MSRMGEIRKLVKARYDNRWWMYEFNVFYEDEDNPDPRWHYGFFKVNEHTPDPDWDDYPLPLWFDLA